MLTSSKDAGQTIIADRGDARVRDFQSVLDAKSDFITRIGWRLRRLRDAAALPIDLIGLLPPDDQPAEHAVYVARIERPLRLVLQ